ncbi:MAG: hypothetical protein U1E36_07945 [Rickettsiales bacterium]
MQPTGRFTSIHSQLSYVAVMPMGTEHLHMAQQAFIRIAGYDPTLSRQESSHHLMVVDNVARALERANANSNFAKLAPREKMKAAEQLVQQSLQALSLSQALQGAALNTGTATRQLLANAFQPDTDNFIHSIMSAHVPSPRIMTNSAVSKGSFEVGKLN